MFSKLIVGAIAPKLLFPGIRIFFILFKTSCFLQALTQYFMSNSISICNYLNIPINEQILNWICSGLPNIFFVTHLASPFRITWLWYLYSIPQYIHTYGADEIGYCLKIDKYFETVTNPSLWIVDFHFVRSYPGSNKKGIYSAEKAKTLNLNYQNCTDNFTVC